MIIEKLGNKWTKWKNLRNLGKLITIRTILRQNYKIRVEYHKGLFLFYRKIKI